MSSLSVVCVVFLIAGVSSSTSSSSSRQITYGPNGNARIEGHVVHGLNNFNGERVVALSGGYGAFFNNPIYEIFGKNQSGSREMPITSSTPRSTQLVIGRDFAEAFPGNVVNTALYNQPYYNIGTLSLASTNIDTRFVPIPYSNAPVNPSELGATTPFLPRSVNAAPTLGLFERASGLLTVDCNNGAAVVTIKACGLFPESLFSVWEVGVSRPGQATEGVYLAPAGGLGNVLRSDKYGRGSLTVDLPWCPVRQCQPGSSVDCQVYFTILHHPDYILWGGAPDGSSWRPYSYPAGVIGASQVTWFIAGDVLQEPLNRWDDDSATCQPGNADGDDDDDDDGDDNNDDDNLPTADALSNSFLSLLSRVLQNDDD